MPRSKIGAHMAALLIAACGDTGTVVNGAATDTELDRLSGTYISGYQAGSGRVLADLYTDSAVLVQPFGPLNIGRDEILIGYERQFDDWDFLEPPSAAFPLGIFSNLAFATEDRIHAGDWVAERGEYDIESSDAAASGHYVRLYRRGEEGGWSVQWDMVNLDSSTASLQASQWRYEHADVADARWVESAAAAYAEGLRTPGPEAEASIAELFAEDAVVMWAGQEKAVGNSGVADAFQRRTDTSGLRLISIRPIERHEISRNLAVERGEYDEQHQIGNSEKLTSGRYQRVYERQDDGSARIKWEITTTDHVLGFEARPLEPDVSVVGMPAITLFEKQAVFDNAGSLESRYPQLLEHGVYATFTGLRIDSLGDFRLPATSNRSLLLPLPDTIVTIVADTAVSLASGSSAWLVVENGRIVGEALLTTNDSAVAGLVDLYDGPAYRYNHLSGELHYVFEVGTQGSADATGVDLRSITEPSSVSGSTGYGGIIDLPASDATCDEDSSIIDIGVYYTDDVFGRGAVELPLASLVEQVNVILVRSEVKARLRVATIKMKAWEESGTLGEDLKRFASHVTSESFNPDTPQRPDLFTLFVDGSRENWGECGRAYVLSAAGTPFYPASVVSYGCAWDDDTNALAHEIGHNLGLEHDRDHAREAPWEEWSYGLRVPGRFRTVMSYPCCDRPGECVERCERMPRFSNPNRPFRGTPGGVPHSHNPSSSADAARTLNLTRCFAARWGDELRPN